MAPNDGALSIISLSEAPTGPNDAPRMHLHSRLGLKLQVIGSKSYIVVVVGS